MKIKSEQVKFLGKLISAIQKEWHNELGENAAGESEDAMNKAHDLLQAAKKDELLSLLAGKSIQEYIGISWLDLHPKVRKYIDVQLRKKY